MTKTSANPAEQSMQDVTDATGRQVVDDIFEESRLKRVPLERDVEPEEVARLELPSDPYIAFHHAPAGAGNQESETLVVASASQKRRYLLKRIGRGRSLRAWQSTPVAGEKLRLLNVYRVMVGQPVAGTR